jgi:hypothetical protein
VKTDNEKKPLCNNNGNEFTIPDKWIDFLDSVQCIRTKIEQINIIKTKLENILNNQKSDSESYKYSGQINDTLTNPKLISLNDSEIIFDNQLLCSQKSQNDIINKEILNQKCISIKNDNINQVKTHEDEDEDEEYDEAVAEAEAYAEAEAELYTDLNMLKAELSELKLKLEKRNALGLIVNK